MKKNPVLLASIALTVFVLAFGSILAVSAAKGAAAAPTPSNAEQQLSVEQYTALVEEANQRIRIASQGQQAASESSATVPNISNSSQTQSRIAPEEALNLALQAAYDPQTVKGSPELIRFEGKLAYEISFEQGAIYLDAATGEILMNGTTSLVPGTLSLEQAVKIAQDYMGLESIYQSDVVSFQGKDIYRIIFNAGHFVYVDKDGQIVYVQIYSPKPTNPTSSSNHSDSSSSNSSDDHSDDDHDSHDDYDDD